MHFNIKNKYFSDFSVFLAHLLISKQFRFSAHEFLKNNLSLSKVWRMSRVLLLQCRSPIILSNPYRTNCDLCFNIFIIFQKNTIKWWTSPTRNWRVNSSEQISIMNQSINWRQNFCGYSCLGSILSNIST